MLHFMRRSLLVQLLSVYLLFVVVVLVGGVGVNTVRQAGTHAATESIFQAFEAARNDVDQVYWLDPVGALVVSCPPLPGKCQDKLNAEFSPPEVIQRALTELGPVFEPVAGPGPPAHDQHHR